MSGPSGNQLVLFSLESWCVPQDLQETKLFPSGSNINYNVGTIHQKGGCCKGGSCGEVAISGAATVLHQRWLVHIVN